MALLFTTVDDVVENAKLSARITHSHPNGVNGAVLQAAATHLALIDASTEETLQILEDLARNLEARKDDENPRLTYSDQLKEVTSMLKSDGHHDFTSGFELGNGIAAIESVPTALYSFLKV